MLHEVLRNPNLFLFKLKGLPTIHNIYGDNPDLIALTPPGVTYLTHSLTHKPNLFHSLNPKKSRLKKVP